MTRAEKAKVVLKSLPLDCSVTINANIEPWGIGAQGRKWWDEVRKQKPKTLVEAYSIAFRLGFKQTGYNCPPELVAWAASVDAITLNADGHQAPNDRGDRAQGEKTPQRQDTHAPWPFGAMEAEPVTTQDFLAFWQKSGLKAHPDDGEALRIGAARNLATQTPIAPWMGPLATASVILLMLNGGYDGREERWLHDPDEVAWTRRNLGGYEPLHPFYRSGQEGARGWVDARLRQFNLSYDTARNNVAFVNRLPYRSKHGSEDAPKIVDHLTSARMVLRWMHDTVFPEARRGDRVVVCLRSSNLWGLGPKVQRGVRDGKALYIPYTSRSGLLCEDPMKQAVIEAVRNATQSRLGG